MKDYTQEYADKKVGVEQVLERIESGMNIYVGGDVAEPVTILKELDTIAQYLLEHETMERDAFLTVFGEKTHEQPENVPAVDAEDQD